MVEGDESGPAQRQEPHACTRTGDVGFKVHEEENPLSLSLSLSLSLVFSASRTKERALTPGNKIRGVA